MLFADIEAPPGGGWTIEQETGVPPAAPDGRPYNSGDAGMPVCPDSVAPVFAGDSPTPGGVVEPMLAIDFKLQGIVVVTARGGKPVSAEWTILARDSEDLGTLHKLTVADGQILARPGFRKAPTT